MTTVDAAAGQPPGTAGDRSVATSLVDPGPTADFDAAVAAVLEGRWPAGRCREIGAPRPAPLSEVELWAGLGREMTVNEDPPRPTVGPTAKLWHWYERNRGKMFTAAPVEYSDPGTGRSVIRQTTERVRFIVGAGVAAADWHSGGQAAVVRAVRVAPDGSHSRAALRIDVAESSNYAAHTALTRIGQLSNSPRGPAGLMRVYGSFDIETELLVAARWAQPDEAGNHPVHTEALRIFAQLCEWCEVSLLDVLDGRAGGPAGPPPMPWTPVAVAGALAPVAEALAAVHALAEPVLHRDLFSSNVLVRDDGSLAVSDFGLALPMLPDVSAMVTHWRGRRDRYPADVLADPDTGMVQVRRSDDVFMFGLLAHELVVGARLPAGPVARFPDPPAVELPAQMGAVWERLAGPRSGWPTMAEMADVFAAVRDGALMQVARRALAAAAAEVASAEDALAGTQAELNVARGREQALQEEYARVLQAIEERQAEASTAEGEDADATTRADSVDRPEAREVPTHDRSTTRDGGGAAQELVVRMDDAAPVGAWLSRDWVRDAVTLQNAVAGPCSDLDLRMNERVADRFSRVFGSAPLGCSHWTAKGSGQKTVLVVVSPGTELTRERERAMGKALAQDFDCDGFQLHVLPQQSTWEALALAYLYSRPSVHRLHPELGLTGVERGGSHLRSRIGYGLQLAHAHDRWELEVRLRDASPAGVLSDTVKLLGDANVIAPFMRLTNRRGPWKVRAAWPVRRSVSATALAQLERFG